jgi:hypothetical protein
MTIKKISKDWLMFPEAAAAYIAGQEMAEVVNDTVIRSGSYSQYTPLLNRMKSTSDVSVVTGSPTITYEMSPTGVMGLKVVASGSVAIKFNTATGQDFSGEMSLYCYGGKATNLDSVTLRVYQDFATNKQFFKQTLFTSNPLNNYKEQGGAISIYNSPLSWGSSGTPDTKFVVNDSRITIAPTSGQTGVFWIYGYALSFKKRKSRISVVIDDGYSSLITLGQPVFDAAGIPTTLACVPSAIDGNFVGYLSKDEVGSYVAGGNAVVAHAAGDLIGESSPQEFLSNLNETNEWIKNNGFYRKDADKCYVWPLGKFQNISGQTEYLDTALGYGVNIARATNPFSGAAQANADALTKYNRLAMPVIGHSWAGTTATESTNISNIVSYINSVADTGGIDVFIVLHKFVADSTPDGSMDLSIRVSDLKTIVTAIKTKVDEGKLVAVTMPELAFDNTATIYSF